MALGILRRGAYFRYTNLSAKFCCSRQPIEASNRTLRLEPHWEAPKNTRRRRNKINDANLMKVQKQLMLALAATQIVVQYQYNVDVALAALWTDPVSATQRHRRPA